MRTVRKGAPRWGGGFVGLLILVLIAAPLTAARPTPAPGFAAIDAWVQAEMGQVPIPGLALAVVEGDQVVHLATFGVADNNGRVVTPQTPFQIESVTKTFTALAIRQLVNAGRVDVSAPVQRYIPWFRVADAEASARITVQNLLDHKSGFSRADGDALYFQDPQYTLEDLIRKSATIRLQHPVGIYEYSNLNYLTLGMIVQQVSGVPYDTYMQRNIFTPLGMTHTYADHAAARRDGLAVGHRLLFGVQVPYTGTPAPATHAEGYLLSSAEDMSRYLTAYFTEGRVGAISILVPVGYPAPAPLASGAFYDSYWNPHRGPASADTWWGQSGGGIGYNADLLLAPAARRGVLVLTNARNDMITPAPHAAFLAEGIMRMQGGAPAPAVTDRGFHLAWVGIDAVLLALVGFALAQVGRLPRWARTLGTPGAGRRGLAFSVGLDFALAAMLLAVPPLLLAPWDVAFQALPDLCAVVLGVAFVLLVVGVAKTGLIVRQWQQVPLPRPHPVAA
jgi:CubicO group peptidase (beta-lactamase class C family)